MWVVGEVQRARASQRGHLYFELVEKGHADNIVGKLDSVIWRGNHDRIRRLLAASDQKITEGLQIRCRGRIDFYGPGGRLQLVISEVDPTFTLGLLEQRRRETLAALETAGLLERNRQLELPELPLRIGLVTSEGSAAYHDFLSGLSESGYGFQVLFVHAAVQGKSAEHEVASAIRAAAGRGTLDCLALIRGGGSRSDLAAFDSRAVAEAVARCPIPVLTGLGHEIDQSISDLVSHTPLKTPTKVAEYLIDRVSQAEEAVQACRNALAQLAEERLRRAKDELRNAELTMRTVNQRLASFGQRVNELGRALGRLSRRRLGESERRLGELTRRLASGAPRVLARQRRAHEEAARRLASVGTSRLREASARLDGLERLCQGLSPRKALERGFSITRRQDGRVLRDPTRAAAGEQITTELGGGTLTSRVEKTT